MERLTDMQRGIIRMQNEARRLFAMQKISLAELVIIDLRMQAALGYKITNVHLKMKAKQIGKRNLIAL